MARNPSTRWYAALAVLIVFVLLAWLLGAVLQLSDGERVALQVGLVALGLIAAAALLWYLRPRDEPVATSADNRDADIGSLVAAARSRLPRGVFDAKPLVLVLGPEGSCKSTSVLRSGTDPELLAGDVPEGTDAARPTALANFWLVKDAVLAEAGGPTFADAALWQKMVRALRPPRLAAALGRAQAAPRAAVVCVSCDLFSGPNAAAQMDALAKVTRDRLTEAARAWGVAMPVYVFFTKADKLANFEMWAAPLDRDEVRAPVGAALPFDATALSTGGTRTQAAGTYAERIIPRVELAFSRLVAELALHRLDHLGRESDAAKRLGAYELPREVGKLAQQATAFLVEICRPVHVGVSPQLRGFYLVGVRPQVVTDVPAAVAARAPGGAAGRPASSATQVFKAGAPAAAAEPSIAAMPTTRRVPQWVFLERLFPEVVLADSGAAAMAKGGVRVATVRRVFLGTGIAAALFMAGSVIRSWMGNSALADRVTVAARDVNALPVVNAPAGTIAFPSADALQRLDALRGVLDTLKQFADSGVPRRLTYGLWRGDTLLGAARRVWLEGYNRQLHRSAYSALTDSLHALPEMPRATDDYGKDYAMLKAYLIMTNESPRSTAEFMAPVLMSSWARGQTLDADVTAMARRQFEFYSALLAQANPWPQAADARTVRHTRDFLNRFSGDEQIYQNLLAKANKAVPPARVIAAAPLAPGIIGGPSEVAGAYTVEGWAFMQQAFKDADFNGEQWVVGDSTAAQTKDVVAVIAKLRRNYVSDYVQRWRTFVKSLTVVRPSGSGLAGARDAARKVGIIGGAQSPLLAVLAMVARNTNNDSSMAAAFQPVHTVELPGAAGTYVNDKNQQYVSGLVAVQGALDAVSFIPEPRDSAGTLVLTSKAQESLAQVILAKGAARQLAQKFSVDTAAVQLNSPVSALLEAPISGAENVLRTIANTRAPTMRAAPVAGAAVVAAPPSGGGGGGGGGEKKAGTLAAELNERGRNICAALTPMLSKFPFNSDASTEATVNEVVALLAPGTGQLAAFQQERLGDLLEKQGGRWVAKPGIVALSAPFVDFFNKASRVSDALFSGGSSPRVVFLAKGEVSVLTPVVTLLQGTQRARFDQNAPPAQFVWPSSTGREANLLAQFKGERERSVARATGEWAIFRLVASATKVEGGRAEWSTTGKGAQPVAVAFTIESGAPVFQRGWLGNMTCASQVTR
jgi:type VI secretion system protein ImpL